MIKFTKDNAGVELVYKEGFGSGEWVSKNLVDHGEVTLSRVFTFRSDDLLGESNQSDEEQGLDSVEYRFRFATRRDGYFHVPGRVFNIENPVLISEKDIVLERATFIAERNISIVGKIAALTDASQPIVLGGTLPAAIPAELYAELLTKFPNTGELNRYSSPRVATVVGDYLSPHHDAREKYELYLNRRRSTIPSQPLRYTELLRTETNKYLYIRDTLNEWLRGGADRSERDWQNMIINFLLLIFPKYVALLSNVQIPDAYSNPAKLTKRFIDLALVDASGSIDVIEIKKPFDGELLARGRYRDNYVPARELSGGIMQAEKYLFHLAKWGTPGEKILTERYQDKLPTGLSVRITNPKSIIILGRDRCKDGLTALTPNQSLDLEIIKRKYSNMIDVMTYDDLLRRLDNIIASLQVREAEMARSDSL